jgi:hypothetical protein
VERGSQEENKVVRIARGSLDRKTCGGNVRFKDLVIFSVKAASLASVR